MRYCPRHQRGLLPEGYDPYGKRRLPARWRPLSQGCVALAVAMGTVFGCGGEIAVKEVPCDQCSGTRASEGLHDL